MTLRPALLLAALPFAAPLPAQRATATDASLIAAIDGRSARYADLARQIWSFAEVGYQEVKSSALLASELEAAGFKVTRGVAEIPTAFVAEFGSGRPVIGILGEFDALPGLSQDATPLQKAIAAGAAGHGCGHNLFGVGSAAAAIAVKDWMTANRIAGTLRFYGTPAEEGGSGKVYMVRDGLFRDVDAVIAWHPGDVNDISGTVSQANVTGKFRFRGVSAHAAASPERGRSALDGVEAMNAMVNMMREHVPQETRIHYVITSGGRAPNVVPDFAEVYYYVRQHDMKVLDDVWERVMKAAQGAALGTGTTVDFEITGSVYPTLLNETLAKVMYEKLQRVGGVKYSAEEEAWAKTLQQSLGSQARALETAWAIAPWEFGANSGGSTDVADVSWNVPTVQIGAATWVPGTAAHSWQAVAASGMSIGAKGMMVAAKTMALTAADLFGSPATLAAARAEMEQRRGKDFVYRTRLGDRKPALDYRK
ncbi:MAG: amidohydrolase [Gemmatimonadaceae bacterium]|nr:amidohydrolase [Gemmatimonadaceae bacterium]